MGLLGVREDQRVGRYRSLAQIAGTMRGKAFTAGVEFDGRLIVCRCAPILYRLFNAKTMEYVEDFCILRGWRFKRVPIS